MAACLCLCCALFQYTRDTCHRAIPGSNPESSPSRQHVKSKASRTGCIINRRPCDAMEHSRRDWPPQLGVPVHAPFASPPKTMTISQKWVSSSAKVQPSHAPSASHSLDSSPVFCLGGPPASDQLLQFGALCKTGLEHFTVPLRGERIVSSVQLRPGGVMSGSAGVTSSALIGN